ncbi:hypothetical protein LTR66_013045 [Elasticomyces elasticus]|nr:hypothetical protein LTR66_013045 [Elasticomyces elasticus]KAK4967562.1 hypothetical protein LTR28_002609 [Elasticomyces elasticus]
MLINYEFPGPLVEANEGDTIVVHVANTAVNATSIHWHGLYQNGTPWMDGTVGITQCPIAPGSSFTYEFKVDDQAGTYWYYAHQGVQASDGLIGPLVIHAKNEEDMRKLSYATDRVIMFSDHYYDLSGALLRKYLEPDRENAEPVPDGALINGIPGFVLAPNAYHRLRIINAGAFAEFQVQIDEHEFAVTEVDGTDVWPEYYHRLNINPAQRYSIVINTNITTANAF